ncbi:MAG: DUF4430 domain-containing protein [Oscillospiraceae bacterium]|nr:DUF4430 domain-containing protein [Oscillospiraceae bacterium]
MDWLRKNLGKLIALLAALALLTGAFFLQGDPPAQTAPAGTSTAADVADVPPEVTPAAPPSAAETPTPAAPEAPAAQQDAVSTPAPGAPQTADAAVPVSPPTQALPSPEVQSACTITIECSAVLANPEALPEEKRTLVPDSGQLLAATTVPLTGGETVFDVLCAAANAAGVQLEYSYTPLYGSYYLEGIGNLYEFDAGETSGWVYTVNGVSQSVGASSCAVSPGDRIVWSYTCSLGAGLSQ